MLTILNNFLFEVTSNFYILFDSPIFNSILTVSILVLIGFIILSSGIGGRIIKGANDATAIGAGIATIYTAYQTASGGNNNNKDDKKDDKKDNTTTNSSSKVNSFFLFSILSNLETGNSSLNQFAFGIFIISITGLLCFLNISFYLISYYLIQKGNYENKYPRFRKLINYYKNISMFNLTIEIIICFICLLSLVVSSFFFLFV